MTLTLKLSGDLQSSEGALTKTLSIMKIEKFASWLSFNTEDIEYYDLFTLGTPGNFTYRCKAELKREFNDKQQKAISIKVDYCFGKTLAELEQNCIKKIKESWERYHEPSKVRTYADTMWM